MKAIESWRSTQPAAVPAARLGGRSGIRSSNRRQSAIRAQPWECLVIYLLALLIGVVAGLRAMTAPAAIAWAAYLGWLDLSGSWLAFLGSVWAVGILTIL